MVFSQLLGVCERERLAKDEDQMATTFLATILAIGSVSIASCNGFAQVAELQDRPSPPTLLLGTSWYPSQWPKSRWPADLELMQKANIHFVRVADVECCRLKPAEGQFDLDWLEDAINQAGAHGIRC